MPNSTLLFIGDISGFTRFVSSRTPEDGVQMAKEMLDIIVSSNKLGLQLCEVEGDAVFFYTDDRKLSFDKLSKQVKRTFRIFQDYLYRHGLESELGIKFIVHAGHCPRIKVGGKSKLFGQEVIRLHRLLKSDTEDMNHLIVTESAAQFLNDVPAGEMGAVSFEHLGSVRFKVFDRAFLWSQESNESAGFTQRTISSLKYILSSFHTGHAFAIR